MNQIEFNYETYLEGRHKLQTRGGIEIDGKTLKPHKGSDHDFEYSDPINGRTLIDSKGSAYNGLEGALDLFMIPIQTDETIPFDLEKLLSKEYDLFYTIMGNKAKSFLWHKFFERLTIEWDNGGVSDENIETLKSCYCLKPKPISPFTHPHLYEVSDDEKWWFDILKYYDEVSDCERPHKVLLKGKCSLPYRHLRLKQPAEISKDQAFDAVANLESVKEKLTEKFGTFKIKES